MAAFVPAGIGAGAIQHAIDDKRRHTLPSSPEMPAEPAGDAEQREPNQRVADRRAVAALHQFLEPFARDGAGIPFRRGQAQFLGELAVLADETVIAF